MTPLASSPWTGRAVTLNLLLVALIVVAYVAPRAVAYRGVQTVSVMAFFDGVGHLRNADKLYRLHAQGPQHVDSETLIRAEAWPRGVYHVTRLFMGWFGPLSLWTTQATNLLFSVVLVLGVIGLGASLFNLRVGLLGALLCILCPGLAAPTWYFTLDYPLAAMTMVGLLLLHRSRGFTSWQYSLLLGAWSVAGLYVKHTYALYLLAPSVVVLCLGLRSGPSRVRVLGHVAAAVALTVGLSLLLGNIGAAQWTALSNHVVPTDDGAMYPAQFRSFGLARLLANGAFAALAFPYPLLLLALPGLILAHIRPYRRPLLLATAFLWGSYLILTLMVVKMERYVIPLYPMLCLLTAWWACSVRPARWLDARRWRGLVAAAVALCYGLVLATGYHAPPNHGPPKYSQDLDALYELKLPGAELLDVVRKGNYQDSTCKLSPLVKEVIELSGLNHRPGPIGLFGLDDSGLGEFILTQPLMGHILLAANHRSPERFFFEGSPEAARATSSFIWFGPAGWSDQRLQKYTVVGSRKHRLVCEAGSKPLKLLLLTRD